MFPNAKSILTNANLGIAQRVGIKSVDTRYFAFVDDDTELSEGFLLAFGDDIPPNSKIENAHILDLAPSVLAFFGFSKPDNMCGNAGIGLFLAAVNCL